MLKRDDQLKFRGGVNSLQVMVASLFMAVTRNGNWVLWLVICLLNQDPVISQVLPASLVWHQLILENSLVTTVGMDQAGQLGKKRLQRCLLVPQGISLQHPVYETL